MIWLIGFKTVNKLLWQGELACRRCLQRRPHWLNELTDWGTLFFVPIVPLRRERQLTCAACGLQTALSKSEAAQFLKN